MSEILNYPPIGIIDGFDYSDGEWFIGLYRQLERLAVYGTVQTVGATSAMVVERPAAQNKAFLAIGFVSVAEVGNLSNNGMYRMLGRGYRTTGVVTISASTILSMAEPDASMHCAVVASGTHNVGFQVTGQTAKTFTWGGEIRLMQSS
jgi:hypothetical protein